MLGVYFYTYTRYETQLANRSRAGAMQTAALRAGRKVKHGGPAAY